MRLPPRPSRPIVAPVLAPAIRVKTFMRLGSAVMGLLERRRWQFKIRHLPTRKT
jgi:hypothetical protein